MRSGTLLVLSQVYLPDPSSVGQYMHDVAAEMVRRGFRVSVLAADRGYDDPERRYRRRQRIDGVEVSRLPMSSLGKQRLLLRILGQLSFLFQCVLRGLFTRRLAGIFISTSPPMCGVAALAIAAVRRVPIKYWVMDVNPDQVVALGRFEAWSLPVRLFERLNRWILGRAAAVVTLDDFMADRLRAKRDLGERLSVIPLWPHEEHLEVVPHEDNPFRKRHGLDDGLVLAYSGNHSPFNPIDTLLEAARRLEDSEDLTFCFIGGGIDKPKVDRQVSERAPGNLLSLPYQPLDQIKFSLSAADVHLVTMGESAVGCCHPSKIYAALAVGRPILFVGPERSHLADLIRGERIGWCVAQGDTGGVVAAIGEIVRASRAGKAGGASRAGGAGLEGPGRRARRLARTQMSQQVLCGRFCDVLEQGLARPAQRLEERAPAPADLGSG